jgi:hypothetical protein
LALVLITAARKEETPPESACYTPDFNHLGKIEDLLDEAINKRSQLALKELVRDFLSLAICVARQMCYQLYWNDGLTCPFTSLHFAPPSHPVVP